MSDGRDQERRTRDDTATTAPRTLVSVKGKGTAHEQRLQTTIPLYWSATLQQWVTIPTDTEGAQDMSYGRGHEKGTRRNKAPN